MKRLLLASGCFAGLMAGTALAADLPTLKSPSFEPPSQAYSWTGFYVGLNAGTGMADYTGGLSGFSAGLSPAVTAGTVPAALTVGPDGPIAGAGLGYRWQTGAFVIGAETDFQGSLLNGGTTTTLPAAGGFFSTTTNASERLLWFGTARARAGYLVAPNILLYGTGGLAYGEARESYYLASTGGLPAGTFGGSTNATRFGWTAGAGAEWKMTENISFTTEYLRVDLGTSTLTAPGLTGAGLGSVISYRFHDAYNIFRGGLNYQFDLFGAAPAVAKY